MECIIKMKLKESKKFAVGCIHENGGGKFEILRRWLDKETNTVMLEYKFLEDGRIETNKEVNVNASEWKWRRNRGLTGSKTGTNIPEEISNILERFSEELNIKIEKALSKNINSTEQLKAAFDEQHKILIELMSIVNIQQKQIESLINDRNLINKLLEKI